MKLSASRTVTRPRPKSSRNAFSPLNVLSANVMWPLAVVPYTLILLAASLIPGHSSAVAKALRAKRDA